MIKCVYVFILLGISQLAFSREVAEQALLRSTIVSSEINENLPQEFEGTVSGDLYDSVLKKTQNESWAETLALAFKDDFSTSKGLKIEVKYYFQIDSDDQITYARLIVGKAMLEKELIFDEVSGLYILSNKLPELEDRQFFSPVKLERISSHFNLSRRHPVKRRRILPHNGVDFTAKSRTPIYPTMSGLVIEMGRARSKGKYILIEHDNGMKSTYDHLRVFQKGLRVGDYVEVDNQIGEVGRTGYATGNHLHFGLINQDGFYVNPIFYLKDFLID
ncbi:MAG: M23 family metallopeptidase [Bacteriovoracaceae bacterium]|nr:M23 family metallopeptidase [Bacteriovoracaceae bacterium]